MRSPRWLACGPLADVPWRQRSWRVALLSLCAMLLGLAASGCASLGPWVLGVDEVSPERVRELMATPGAVQILDVREAVVFREGHIPGALAARYQELDELLPRSSLDRRRPVVAVCARGRLSLAAVAVLRGHGFEDASSMQEGMAGWRSRGLELETGEGQALSASGPAPPAERISVWQQVAETAAGLGFKPTYMLLSLALGLALLREKARDLKLLRWGLLLFFLGEAACAIDYWIAGDRGLALDLIHGTGMVLMGMLVGWGLFELLESRVLRMVEPEARCALQRFCGRCWKQGDASCGLHRMMLLVAPALAVLAMIPWSTPLRTMLVHQRVFLSDVQFSYSLGQLLVDFRLFPLLAVLCFLTTFALLWGGVASLRRAKLPFFAGLGLMSFSVFRHFLVEAYRSSPVWLDFWEEATELVLTVALGFFLLTFRKQLGWRQRAQASG